MDGYGNGDLSKEDQRRSVEEESARGQREDKVRGVCKGQREDRVRGGKASSKWRETPEQWNVPTLYNWNSGTNSIKGGRIDHNEDLDQDRIKNDRAELKIQQDCPGGTIIVRTWEEKSLEDIRDHSKKFGRSRMQIGRAD
ncbi:unnamed protein product [Microthlaspi erraticum]|uniref:Uncharacterized protein n=1 Tax=Microthlaspi erraticum TaxID=1685480 RepID=A0A6D2KM97_9BRAS|nr:unnamed protein product [Microthlaspi erraticum]